MLAYEITRLVDEDEEAEDEGVYYKTIVTSFEAAFKAVLKMYDRKSIIVITIWEDSQCIGETRFGRNV